MLADSPMAQVVKVEDFLARSHRISASKSLPYRLFVPKTYKPANNYPIMITLHGAGERGTDNSAQLVHDFNKRWAADSLQALHPAFVLAPQCPPNNKWVDADWAKGPEDDNVVPVSGSRDMVNGLKAAGGKPRSLRPGCLSARPGPG